MNEQTNRQGIIVRTSVIGIITNLLLAGFKAGVGLAANSISVVLDAVNNLSDALSSVITIFGAKLANRRPDKDHPLGHGRIEYLSALIVASIVLYAGLTSLVESVKKMFDPGETRYSTLALVIIAVAVIAKILLGRYVKAKGKETNSGALVASGTDALSDAAISAGVLLTALINVVWGLSLEAYMGAIISVFIIKAGIEMISDTVADILGRRTDPEVSAQIKKIVSEEPDVFGAYDLFVHDYGPGREYASVHVELPDSMTVEEVDRLTRRVTERVYRETGVILTGVSVYSKSSDENTRSIQSAVEDIVMSHDWAIGVHGFHLDDERKIIRFDVVVTFDVSHSEAVKTVCDEIKARFPEYEPVIVVDIDITD